MSDEITARDMATLERQPLDVLPVWWCVLNRWGWPKGLPDEEDQPGPMHKLTKRRRSMMEWIEQRVGMKACLAEWNRKRDRKETP